MTKDAVENLQSMAASGERAFKDYRIVDKPHPVEIGGRKGAYVKATYTLSTKDGQRIPTSFQTWHSVRGDHYFLIGVVSRQPEDQITEKELKQIIASFRIAEISVSP